MTDWKATSRVLFKALFSSDRDYYRYLIAEKLSGIVYPKYVFSEFGRIWLDDKVFRGRYDGLEPTNHHSVDRKFFLASLLNLVDDVSGDSAECGAYRGASSWFVCNHLKGKRKLHHIFDSFEGISEPSGDDGHHWRKGDLSAPEEELKKNLSEFDHFEVHKGWIPASFELVRDRRFCFVHLDVDLHQPTLDSLTFFYPRMTPGGIILCDDYGFSTCPGAKKAFDDFIEDKEERIVHVPTGQAFIIKK